jgi:hypothetical protein
METINSLRLGGRKTFLLAGPSLISQVQSPLNQKLDSKPFESKIGFKALWIKNWIQSPLNQKLDSKSFRVVDFASRFIIIIESMNFEFRFY